MPLTFNSEEIRAITAEKLDAKTVDLIVIDSFIDIIQADAVNERPKADSFKG